MFEREILDSMFVKRWGIVRTLVPQSIAEHTFVVTHYANDICSLLDLDPATHLAVLQYAMWHDMDECFTGDMPGPNKRGLLEAAGGGAKALWDAKLKEWAKRTFSNLYFRSGGHASHSNHEAAMVKAVVKCADWLESSTRMATESQMGNGCTIRHIEPNMNGAIEAARDVIFARFGKEYNETGAKVYRVLIDAIKKAVEDAQTGQSVGPWITKEDISRTFHDPAVDA